MAKIKNTACVILAAGLGKRMRSSVPKVLHKISGKAMIEYVLDIVRPLGVKPIIVVTGRNGAEVRRFVKAAMTAGQKKPLGSADAVMAAKGALAGFGGDVLVLCGDMPLIRRETIQLLINRHKDAGSSCTILTARVKDPSGYGRILRDDDDNITRIVEESEASLYDKVINEINTGAYCFASKDLFEGLRKIKADNKKNEYYLTDIIEVFKKRGLKIASSGTVDEDEALGINSRRELAKAEGVIRERAIDKFLRAGVTIIDPLNTYISADCVIGGDTVIRPYTIIENDVKIGAGCLIGPFARIRSGAELADGVEIGNFVELTRSDIGRGTKIKHHSYIGDSLIGKGVNIGAGTITANYDGKNKNKTVIKDGAFIGSGTIFVAPVTVGKKAVTGAGSVLTKGTKVAEGSVVAGVPARALKSGRRRRG